MVSSVGNSSRTQEKEGEGKFERLQAIEIDTEHGNKTCFIYLEGQCPQLEQRFWKCIRGKV